MTGFGLPRVLAVLGVVEVLGEVAPSRTETPDRDDTLHGSVLLADEEVPIEPREHAGDNERAHAARLRL
jgi:hypothetical protein